MRGKVASSGASSVSFGITPAHAGKSVGTSAVSGANRDHPRPCGEKLYDATGLDADKGSPPPMRGKVHARSIIFDAPRITPAHAGKSICAMGEACFLRDHPRPCGEKSVSVSFTVIT